VKFSEGGTRGRIYAARLTTHIRGRVAANINLWYLNNIKHMYTIMVYSLSIYFFTDKNLVLSVLDFIIEPRSIYFYQP
jgi:hypothetical protein